MWKGFERVVREAELSEDGMIELLLSVPGKESGTVCRFTEQDFHRLLLPIASDEEAKGLPPGRPRTLKPEPNIIVEPEPEEDPDETRHIEEIVKMTAEEIMVESPKKPYTGKPRGRKPHIPPPAPEKEEPFADKLRELINMIDRQMEKNKTAKEVLESLLDLYE